MTVQGSVDAVMDRLSDDLLVNILSRLTLKKAARTSVLARRWTCLWRSGALVLDSESLVTAKGGVIEPEKFESLLNTLLQVRPDDRCIERLAIFFDGGMLQQHCERMSQSVAIWMYAAVQHDGYGFQMFSRLKSLRLVHVEVEDEAVHHLLASARALEELRVSFSKATKNLRVVDPPSLRVLEISGCCSIESVEISAAKLVSLTYGGGKNSLLLREAPKLCEVRFISEFAASFVLEPKQDYSSFSAQLVELVLYLHKSASPTPIVVNTPHLPLFASLKRLKVAASSAPGHSLHLFTLLVEASPQLVELSLEMSYSDLEDDDYYRRNIAFPSVWSYVKFDHKSLKVIEMSGFVGSQDEAELLIELSRNAPLLERVVIHTNSDYYGDFDWYSFRKNSWWQDTGARTQTESKMRAKRLEYFCNSRIQFIIK